MMFIRSVGPLNHIKIRQEQRSRGLFVFYLPFYIVAFSAALASEPCCCFEQFINCTVQTDINCHPKRPPSSKYCIVAFISDPAGRPETSHNRSKNVLPYPNVALFFTLCHFLNMQSSNPLMHRCILLCARGVKLTACA